MPEQPVLAAAIQFAEKARKVQHSDRLQGRIGKPMQVTDGSGVLRNQTGIIGGLHHGWVACRHRRSAAKRSVFQFPIGLWWQHPLLNELTQHP
jgi:hypothetical protein